MRRHILGLATLTAAALAAMAPASAPAGTINAAAAITSKVEADGLTYDYTITLKESAASTDPIGTFWFAWLPGKDFMANKPLSEINPTGWTPVITGGNAGNGYAIQWVAGAGSAIPIGGSLDFGFRSLETPAQLAGNSPFFPGTPELTSVVYNGAPLAGDSQTFTVTPSAVPEPSTLILSALGGLTILAGRRVAGRFRSSAV